MPIKFVYAGGRRLVVVIIICTFENEMLLTGKKVKYEMKSNLASNNKRQPSMKRLQNMSH